MSAQSPSQSITELPGLTLFKRFEGGAVYIQNLNGKYCVVIDESSIADLLPQEELDDLTLIKVFEFNNEHERLAYLMSRFGE